MAESEDERGKAAWIDAYVQTFDQLDPELSIDEATRLAREAFAREGRWKSARIAAWGDALFGPLLVV